MTRSLTGAMVCFALLFAGCRKDPSSTIPIQPGTAANNTPVVANTQNAFSFDLTASSYTSTLAYPLSFTTDSLACSLNVASNTAGTGSLKVTDANNAMVYGDSVLSNQVIASTQAGKGMPKSIQLVFSNYTGVLTFALAKNTSAR